MDEHMYAESPHTWLIQEGKVLPVLLAENSASVKMNAALVKNSNS